MLEPPRTPQLKKVGKLKPTHIAVAELINILASKLVSVVGVNNVYLSPELIDLQSSNFLGENTFKSPYI